MTTKDEALKLALEALSPWAGEDANHTEQYAAYQALREALAEQPAQQEPMAVARVDDLERGGRVRALAMGLGLDQPLYTSPPAQRTWVGLTDEEIEIIFNNWPTYHLDHEEFARVIENILREKNS